MQTGVGKTALAIAAFGLCAGAAAPAAADTASEIRALKARLNQLEAQVAHQRAEVRHATNVANAAHAHIGKNAGPPPPPPVFVSFKNGLFVETEDKAYSFKVGGRIMVDGGGISQPLNGLANHAAFRQIRLEVEGKAAKVWFYKLQYDFAGTGQIVANNQTVGGIRDFYFGIQHPALTLPFAKEPVFLMVGSQFEPFSLESTASSKYRDLIERAMAVEGIAPNRHIGLAVGAYDDKWSVKAGVFTTSAEDASLTPAQNTPPAWGVPAGARWVSTGGSQYFDLSGRGTYALWRDEHSLVHVGVSGRYHRPNDSTAASNDRVLRLGNRLRSEANVLGQGLLGTPDLSCGSYTFSLVTTGGAAGHCVRDMTSYGFEVAASYGPFAMQGEYIATDYNRDYGKILQARSSGVFAPGGSRQHFGGFYVWGEYWLTGEERAKAYDTKDKAGANFGQVKINNPVSAGGYGALGLIARYSSINLNSGPYSGSGLTNMLAYTTMVAPNAAATSAILNAGVAGGRQENVTGGLNWYPDNGIHLQFNWTHVLHVSAPVNDYIFAAPAAGLLPGRQGAYINGAHPDLFEARAQVYW